MKSIVYIGSEIKVNLNIKPIGEISMEDYSFTVEAYCAVNRRITVQKNEAIKVDSDTYTILLNTNNLGPGKLKLKIVALIPDNSFESGTRTEVEVVNTGIEIRSIQ